MCRKHYDSRIANMSRNLNSTIKDSYNNNIVIFTSLCRCRDGVLKEDESGKHDWPMMVTASNTPTHNVLICILSDPTPHPSTLGEQNNKHVFKKKTSREQLSATGSEDFGLELCVISSADCKHQQTQTGATTSNLSHGRL